MNIKWLGSVVGLCLVFGFVMPHSASADILIDGTYSPGTITGTLTVDGTTKTVTNVDLTTTGTYNFHFNIIAQQFPNSGFWIVSTKDISKAAYLELALDSGNEFIFRADHIESYRDRRRKNFSDRLR